MLTPSLTIRRGDTWSQAVIELGDLTGFAELWFTAKESYDDSDVEAIIGIAQTIGLTRLNGGATTAAWGDITVDSLPLGNITITIEADATSQLPYTALMYDIQVVIGGVVTTLAIGNLEITGDVTRAIS